MLWYDYVAMGCARSRTPPRAQFHDVHGSPAHRETGLRALAVGDVAASAPLITIAKQQPGYVCFVPVSRRGAPATRMLAVAMWTEPALSVAVGDIGGEFVVTVTDVTAGLTIFSTGGAAGVDAEVSPAHMHYVFQNRTWDVAVSMTPAALDAAITTQQRSVLVVGITAMVVAGALCASSVF